MTIVFVINEFSGGGRERRLIQLIKGFDEVGGYNIHAIVFHGVVEYPEINETSASIHVLDPSSRITQIKKYIKILSDIRPDIVHNWVETPIECTVLPILAKLFRAKYIAGFVADGNRVKSARVRIPMKIAFSLSDAIISNSEAGLIAKEAPTSKSFVIYNGFDDKRLSRCNYELKRQEMGGNIKYIVTMCARVNEAKDWNMFIKLAQLVKNDNLEVLFLAVGNGSLLNDYRKKVVEGVMDNVKFIGRRTDVEDIIAVSDVCVLFTNNDKHAEGVSNFIMESMAAGKPVVATDGGGTPEIISNNIDGFIVKPSDVSSAYERVKSLLESTELRDRIGHNARLKIEEKFSLAKMTQEYDCLYRKL